MRSTLSHRLGLLVLGGVFATSLSYSQAYRMFYEQRDGYNPPLTNFTKFIDLDTSNNDVANGSFVTRGRIQADSPSSVNTNVIRTRLEQFTGGDTFGRLAIGFGNTNRNTNSEYNLPSDRSGNLAAANTGSFALFGTWVSSGHVFRMRASGRGQGLTSGGQVRYDAEIRNAPMVSLASGPSPSTPDLTPFLWGSGNIDPNAFPSIVLNWNSGAVSGTRAGINFVQFGNIASPHSDRLRVRTTLTILQNSNPFYTEIDESFVDWAAGDGTFSKTAAGAGDTYTLNIAGDDDYTQYCISLRVQVFHDGYYDNFGGYAGTVTLYDQQVYNECFTVVVPEPASMVALGAGLAGLLGLRRRSK